MKSSYLREVLPFSLLALVLASASSRAAVVLGSLPVPVITNHIAPFDQGVDLSTGLDWVKYQGGANSTEKTGTAYLATSLVGAVTRGTFTPTVGYQFTWSDGAPTASGTNRTHTNGSSMGNGVGWNVTATGLAALAAGDSYRLEFWGGRTDNTPFSIEVYNGATFLGRQSVNGSTAADGANTDGIYSVVDFTVGGISDTLEVRFIRDTTNAAVGTIPSVNNAILAAGGWRLTTIPEPSSALLGAIGSLLLVRRRRF